MVNNQITSTDKFKPTDEVTWRDVNGEVIVLTLTSGEYYSFNEVGRLSWISLVEGKQVSEVVAYILNNYQTTSDQAKQDLEQFIGGLLENHLLVKDQ